MVAPIMGSLSGGEHILGERGNLVGHTRDGAVGHDHNHGNHLAFGQEIVQNPACGTYAGPGSVVVSTTVDEI